MNIAIVGSGYVGLVSGTCYAESGNEVVCVDIDQNRIAQLCEGKIPIYEPGLEELVRRNLKEGRLRFTTDIGDAIKNSMVSYIAVGTPMSASGAADLTAIFKAAEDIAKSITGYHIVAVKSTVPVGTNDRVREIVGRVAKHRADVTSVPEFLKEGSAIEDFMRPDRVVIGSLSEQATAVLKEIHNPFVRTDNPILVMDPRSAELTKYASNAMLAMRISFINEMATLYDAVGADINAVRRGLGTDKRIGSSFLFPGVGYGGARASGGRGAPAGWREVPRARSRSARECAQGFWRSRHLPQNELRGAQGCRRAADSDRVERVPASQFSAHQVRAEAAGDIRWPEPV